MLQGVHGAFEIKKHETWRDNEPRVNQLVFIGKNLRKETVNIHRMLAEGVGFSLRIESGSSRGPPPFLPRLVVMAILLSLMFYPDECWAAFNSTPVWMSVPVIGLVLYYVWTHWS